MACAAHLHRNRVELAVSRRRLERRHVLSDHTGGFAVTGTANYRDFFDRIVRESSTYYLLAYTSSNNKSDGKYRRTQVNVKRPGVQAFYRSGYMARRP